MSTPASAFGGLGLPLASPPVSRTWSGGRQHRRPRSLARNLPRGANGISRSQKASSAATPSTGRDLDAPRPAGLPASIDSFTVARHQRDPERAATRHDSEAACSAPWLRLRAPLDGARARSQPSREQPQQRTRSRKSASSRVQRGLGCCCRYLGRYITVAACNVCTASKNVLPIQAAWRDVGRFRERAHRPVGDEACIRRAL
ncbi:hypothetical protein MRX96_005221 [Rhipicephalus microplus]